MPVRDWPTDYEVNRSADAQRPHQLDSREYMLQACRLLRDLLAASQQLGDALVQAGLSPGVWRKSDARLTVLNPQSPPVTLDALLTRLHEFATETGPGHLAGDGGALDEFERNVRDIGDVLRPLRALAQRERLIPRRERQRTALWQAFGDVRVGIAFDRLSRIVLELHALTPHLRPLSSTEWRDVETLLAAGDSAANAVTAPPAHGQHSGMLSDTAVVASLAESIPNEGASDPDAPTFLPSGWLPDAGPNDPTVPIESSNPPELPPAAPARWLGQRPRTWGLVLLSALLLLAGITALTILARPAVVGLGVASTPSLSSAQSTRAAGKLAHTPTVTPRPAATPTLAGPARLVASPNPLALSCSGTATLTLSNTGGRASAWTASASFGAHVFPSSGTVQPGDSAGLTVSSYGASRGSVTIRWTGGTLKDAFRLQCHG